MTHRTISSFLLLTLLLPVEGRSEQASPTGCPLLPEQASGNAVALYVAKAPDTPGFVCVRAINGLSEDLAVGGNSLRLQRWEKEKWWRAGGFRDFVETPPPGLVIGTTLPLMNMPPGTSQAARLPRLGQPAPAGRYRVCFQSELVRPDRSQATLCSAEFTLP